MKKKVKMESEQLITSGMLDSPTMASLRMRHAENNNQDEHVKEILLLTADDTGLGDVDNQNGINAISKDDTSIRRGTNTAEDRFRIGKYAAENGHAAMVRRFSSVYANINESTAHGFASKYKATLYDTENNCAIPNNKGGRPLRLGPIDGNVVSFELGKGSWRSH